MKGNKRYLAFRTDRLEKQNRWLTILASAVIVVLIIAITAGPALVRFLSDEDTDETAELAEQLSDTQQ